MHHRMQVGHRAHGEEKFSNLNLFLKSVSFILVANSLHVGKESNLMNYSGFHPNVLACAMEASIKGMLQRKRGHCPRKVAKLKSSFNKQVSSFYIDAPVTNVQKALS